MQSYIGKVCRTVMLDKNKIRLMTKSAVYEKNQGEEDLKITSYYKKDYASLSTWITLIWITAGYILAGGIVLLCFGESLMEDLTIMKLAILIAVAAGAYLSLLIIYGICAGNFYSRKYSRAKKRVKKYMRDLSKLERINNKKKENNRL